MNIISESIHRWSRSGVLLAVSGGADSVAMLRRFVDCRDANHRLAVAHVNHGLRGRESDQDAIFVRELAEKFSLPYFERIINAQEWDSDQSGSFESAARNIRYDFLLQTAQQTGLRHIATAHTKNDQIETVLHRIVRGTGIAGLAGIPRVRKINEAVSLVRPFLEITRTEIETYLAELGQPFRTDSSNASAQFTRNRIRLELLPLLKENYNPSVEDAVERLALLAGETQNILDEESRRLWSVTIIRQTKNEVLLKYPPLLEQSSFRVREFFAFLWKQQNWPLRSIGFAQFAAIEETLRSAKLFRQFLPGPVEIIVDSKKETMRISNNVARR